MNPEMPVDEMLDRFIFVVKGSRVIDRTATNWGQAYWLPEKYVQSHVYTLAELKRLFARGHFSRFEKWATHPKRLTASTLSEAMKFADEIARGEYEWPAPTTAESIPPWEQSSGARPSGN